MGMQEMEAFLDVEAFLTREPEAVLRRRNGTEQYCEELIHNRFERQIKALRVVCRFCQPVIERRHELLIHREDRVFRRQ
ncbi:hypothetical protein D3C73_1417720 [compost metagenome]